MRRGALEDVASYNEVCKKDKKYIVMYLAAEAERRWFVVGNVEPATLCLPVTFIKRFKDVKKAVEEPIDHGKRIYGLFPTQFDIALVKSQASAKVYISSAYATWR